MKKIKLAFITSIFFSIISNVWATERPNSPENNVAPSAQNIFQQVYLQNSYIIDQLEVIARAEKKRPHRIDAKLDNIDITLLVIKFNSLNHLMQRVAGVASTDIYQPFNENLIFNEQALLQQSHKMLRTLPLLFKKYHLSSSSVDFDQSSSSRWYTPKSTPIKLYQQLLDIESFLYDTNNAIGPKGVYEIVLSTRNLIIDRCKSNSTKISTPLIMGKRPKDVYSKLINYLESLSEYTTLSKPEHGPIHVLPHDVFDLAIISMAYSWKLFIKDKRESINDTSHYKNLNLTLTKHDIITPSHVHQEIVQNIKILECLSHAS